MPDSILRELGRVLACDEFRHKASTRYLVEPWSATVELQDFDWQDLGFAVNKLKYLAKKYPLDCLPSNGCISGFMPLAYDMRLMVYRRVDLVRGWAADALYLWSLGYRGRVTFSCGAGATVHAVRLSAVFPLILDRGHYVGVHRLLRKTLRRAIVHRLERRYEGYGQAMRMNRWAHSICTEDMMRRALEVLA